MKINMINATCGLNYSKEMDAVFSAAPQRFSFPSSSLTLETTNCSLPTAYLPLSWDCGGSFSSETQATSFLVVETLLAIVRILPIGILGPHKAKD
ncbi:hypothetical protein PoB_006450800 [Plakobranchus ocellatus]|uniref:Uncharacterized protein n=1 Tax=Plakobranchus ocellatus TaxID=259542 RepID=A0AAV4D1U2_9GAST|nr:hypothetical protein PoB_006450800 [Plakobranchus ocellatus]